MIEKRKILIFTDWYVPGFKAGGPIKSVYNLVTLLEKDFDIYVFTSDSDLGENPYKDIESDVWLKRSNHQVYYCSDSNHSYALIKEQYASLKPDVVYINGVFSAKYSIAPLRSLKNKSSKLIVAPRGMLSSGALGLKSTKKKLFLVCVRMLKWFKNVEWHVTSKDEKESLVRRVNPKRKINLIRNVVLPLQKSSRPEWGIDSSIKMIFVGRISRVKNIEFFINVLNKYNQPRTIEFDIIGSCEDKIYWNNCLKKVSDKANYKMNYIGELKSNLIVSKLKDYHLFVSPSLNENFGHSIVEAMQVGLPLLISNQTPWKNLEEYNAGWDLPLDEEFWIEKLNEFTKMSESKYSSMSTSVMDYLSSELDIEQIRKSYLNLFS